MPFEVLQKRTSCDTLTSMKPDAMETTAELISGLANAGLRVTTNMLRQDVRDGYLPAPTTVTRPGFAKGRVGLWDRQAVRRAYHCYRLRRLGLQGDTLRIFLFLRDGWGWEQVQPICLKGVEKLVRLVSAPVRTHVRNVKGLTPTGLSTVVEDMEADRPEWSGPELRLITSMGLFGQVPDDDRAVGLFSTVASLLGLQAPEVLIQSLFPFVEPRLQWDAWAGLVQEADPAMVERARLEYLFVVRRLRPLVGLFFQQLGIKGLSSNQLAAFGLPRAMIGSFLNQFPARPSPAQMLAMSFFIVLLIEHAWQTGEADPAMQVVVSRQKFEAAVLQLEEMLAERIRNIGATPGTAT